MSLRRVTFFLIAFGMAVLPLGTAGAGVGHTVLYVTLGGQQAVPLGDPDGTGTASIRLLSGGRVCFRISAERIGPITGVHIHQAPRGQTGGHFIDLFARVVARPNGGLQMFVDCINTSSSAVNAVASNPGGYYLNVHTAEFPSGAIRGQLA